MTYIQRKCCIIFKANCLEFCFAASFIAVSTLYPRNGIGSSASRAVILKQLIEKPRECHNHKPQSIPDTKRKRKMTEIDACKINKQMHAKHIDQLFLPLFPKRGHTMLNRTKTHKHTHTHTHTKKTKKNKTKQKKKQNKTTTTRKQRARHGSTKRPVVKSISNILL